MSLRSVGSKLLLVLATAAVGCGGGEEDPRGQRVPISGTVTFGGEPLSSGRIVFETSQGEGQLKAAAFVENGAFELDAQNGPLAGTATVRIFSREPELEELEAARQGDPKAGELMVIPRIPPQYNVNSQLKAEIVDGGGEVHSLSFDLASE